MAVDCHLETMNLPSVVETYNSILNMVFVLEKWIGGKREREKKALENHLDFVWPNKNKGLQHNKCIEVVHIRGFKFPIEFFFPSLRGYSPHKTVYHIEKVHGMNFVRWEFVSFSCTISLIDWWGKEVGLRPRKMEKHRGHFETSMRKAKTKI